MRNNQNNMYIKYFSLLVFIFMYTTINAQKAHIGGFMLGDTYTVAKKKLVIDGITGTLYCYKNESNKITKLFYKAKGIITYNEYYIIVTKLTETLNLIAIPTSVYNNTTFSTFKYNCTTYKVIIKVRMKNNNIDKLYLTLILK